MSDAYKLTRAELSEISQNPRIIRVLERLLEDVPSGIDSNATEINNRASKTNQALQTSITNKEEIERQEVLQWLLIQ